MCEWYLAMVRRAVGGLKDKDGRSKVSKKIRQ